MLDITTASTDPAARYSLPTLEQLINRPAWMADAACRGHPDVSWFLEQGEPAAPAKAVCASCLVREVCAAYGAGVRHRVRAARAG